MAARVAAWNGAALAGARVSLARVLWLETRTECVRLLRVPSFSVPVIGFPILFYLLFGVMLVPRGAGTAVGATVLAGFVVFGVMAPGLFGLGVTLAMDRDRGLLALKRALPMPPGAYLGAKLIMAMAFAAVVAILLAVSAVALAHVTLEPLEWMGLLVLGVLGVLPFCALGLLIGTLTKGQAAPAVINLVYLPMSFLSGVLLPLAMLPHLAAQLAPLWPAYQLAELALAVVGRRGAAGHLWAHALILAGMTAVLFALARKRLQRNG